MPVYLVGEARFADGSGDICQAFEQLVQRYGVPGVGSAAIGSARPHSSPQTDILGRRRTGVSSVGAVEP